MNRQHALYPKVKNLINFETLWSQAEDTIHRLSGTIWNDTGDHDPGITILQAATYNIADLSYRASLPLTDLLTGSGNENIFPEEFGPQHVLTCGPITTDDYRRALLDLHSSDIPEIQSLLRVNDEWPRSEGHLLREVCLRKEAAADRFSWYYNSDDRTQQFSEANQKFSLRGNYSLALVPSTFTEQASPDVRRLIERHIASYMENNRNLGERVSSTQWFKPQDMNVRLSLELHDDVRDVERLAAIIYTCIDQQLLPEAARYDSAQLRAAGYRHEEIFQGPFLKHGWLHRLPQQTLSSEGELVIRLSPLINCLLAIPECKKIHVLSLDTCERIRPVANDNWSWHLQPGYYPRLWGGDPIMTLCEVNGPLQLFSRGARLPLDAQRVKRALVEKQQKIVNSAPVPSFGKARDLTHYMPIGDRLPECYRTRQNKDVLRRLDTLSQQQITKLHQFLLPMDQLLADCVADLALLPKLLSFVNRGDQTSGTQWPYSANSIQQALHEEYAEKLIVMRTNSVSLSNGDVSQVEKNFQKELNLLNHLLAYFGTTTAARPLGLNKNAFLSGQRHYLAQQPTLGYDRIRIKVNKVSALQQRLAAQMGLGEACFEDGRAMDNLPFHLIEHRQFLPVPPNAIYTDEQKPIGLTLNQNFLAFEQPMSNGQIRAGQLVDLLIDENENPVQIRCQSIVRTEGDSFLLDIRNSVDLSRHLKDIQIAHYSGKLRWKHSDTWLQDVDYRLCYAPEQPQDRSLRLLASNSQSPYPVMAKPGDKIEIIPRGLIYDDGTMNHSWSISATVEKVDQIAGTLLIKKESGCDFPASEASTRYHWHFCNCVHNKIDRFSFVISLVFDQSLLTKGYLDSYEHKRRLEREVCSALPTHVSSMFHWLDKPDYKDFSQTYQRWQNKGNALGDEAYKLLRMLTLGQLVAPQRGLGAMRIVTQRQAEILPTDPQRREEYILDNELVYVPGTVE